ncbi:SMI1/KNR4 family protein [Streptomyces sp. TLI_185]|uniref:SMI1/KNR4 family protein n=1 Tax=Streptomyces sp. TLI_185 TaxID=2485151 RepID=UPI000F9FED9C|nr:SMI1/KNR4 family protein [Streptomyces sp. TLI_185]RPF34208.1 SMI1/KNR4 family protein SUKH-1 [Streptomyces sp. TLI_185]
MTISGAWERIETWLRNNASAGHASLPGPAPVAELRMAHTQIGRPLPAELADSLRCHNGSGNFVLPVYHRFSDLHLIAREYQSYRRAEEAMRRRAEERHPSVPNQTALLPRGEYYYWNPDWIPFAYDESGNSLFISQVDDDTFGRIGVHDKEDGPSFSESPVFTSLPHLLDGVAQALSDGVFEIWGEWEPVVDDDGLLEWQESELEGDVVWDLPPLRPDTQG